MRKTRLLLFLLTLFSYSCGLYAEPVTNNKPFAENHVVLQISDSDPFKQTLVLNVAGNLLRHYGPDRIDIEVVAFGPGLRLLMAGNVNSPRIESLAADGVRFSACSNTLESFTKKLGEKPVLNSHATVVPAGAVRIMELVKQGYFLLKP
jgi:intracellular sulfur oxidation DsrE/DsrF family protein